MASRREGQITQRGEGRWLVTVYVHRDATGKRVYRSQTVHGGRKAAEKKLRGMLKDKDDRRLVQPSRMAFGDFLDEWLEKSVKPLVRRVTHDNYRAILRRYVRPYLRAIRLDRLAARDLDGLVAKLTADGLSPRTVGSAVTVVKTALKTAVRWKRLPWNPADDVRRPKQVRHEVQVPEAATRAALLAELRRDEHWPVWNLMAVTGLRPSEALGLKWSDVDLDAGLVSVHQVLTRYTRGEWELTAPKTTASRRKVEILAETVDLLRRRRDEQAKAMTQHRDVWAGHDLVFTDEVGRPLDETNLRARHFDKAKTRAALTCATCGEGLVLTCGTCGERLLRARGRQVLKCRKCGKRLALTEGRPVHASASDGGHAPAARMELLKLRPYDLRHLYASLLLAGGVDLKTVQEQLGHANASITLQTYAHSVPGRKSAAARIMAAEVFGKASARKRQTKRQTPAQSEVLIH